VITDPPCLEEPPTDLTWTDGDARAVGIARALAADANETAVVRREVPSPHDRPVGPNGASVGLEHFGESAPAERLMAAYGFTGEHVATVSADLLATA